MTDAKIRAECKNGAKCAHLAAGKCKFTHPGAKSDAKKPVGARATAVKKTMTKTNAEVSRLVRVHAGKILAVQRKIALLKAEQKSFLDVKSGRKMWADVDEEDSLQAQLDLLKQVARSSIGRGVVRATLYVESISASSANTAVAVSFPLVPSASSEWTGFASLYDEVKVTSVDLHYMVGRNVDPSAYIGGSSVWVALGYDSTYNSTPANVPDVLESSQHKLTVAASLLGTTVSSATPECFRIRIPQGPVANATPVTGGTGIVANFPGEWMACGDTADSVGYLRLYISAGGTASVIGYRTLYAFHCEFRERT